MSLKVILHIGTHKTGTTAIQRFLARNRKALAQKRILYPTKFTKYDGHHPLPWALGVRHPDREPRLKPGEVAQGILAEARKADADTVILSSEEFRNLGPEVIAALPALFPDATMQVIVYLRRQDDYLLSEYGQHLRMYATRFAGTPYDFYIKYNFINKYNYWALLNRWAKPFGDEAMRVRIYDRARFPGGNVLADFLPAIDVSPEGMDIDAEAATNRNLSPLAMEVLRRCNTRALDEASHHRLITVLDRAFTRNARSYTLLSDQNRRDLMACFAPSNAMVAKKWLGREDGVLFDPPASSGNMPHLYEEEDQSVVIGALLDSLLERLRQSSAS